MRRDRPAVLFLFVDGVGLAPVGPDNPLATVPMPATRALLGGPLVRELAGEAAGRRDGVVLEPADATLGVDGLPQSATGQTSLFTGVNAAAALGRHVTALPGPRLRAILAEHGFLMRLAAAGRTVTFANPYPAGYAERVRSGEVRAGATTWTALGAGLRLRDPGDLAAGRAVAWDVTGERLRERLPGVVPVTPDEAGRRLAALVDEHDLVLWETFLTDLAGHRRVAAADALVALDGLLGGIAEDLPRRATVVLASDHGNLEDGAARQHTRNPVPLLAFGRDAAAFAGTASILDVVPRILGLLAPEAGGADPADAPETSGGR